MEKAIQASSVRICECGKPALKTSTTGMCKQCEIAFAQSHAKGLGMMSLEDLQTLTTME